MPATNKKGAYISAKIRNVRLLNESAGVAELSSGETISLEMTDNGTVEALWEITQNNEVVLAIIPTIDAVFKDKNTGAAVFNYSSRHDVRFSVESFTGFDPTQDLPSPAIEPYLEMAVWLAKGRAQAAIRSMGLSQFVWPQIQKMEKVDDSPSPPDAKPKKRRAAKSSV